MVIRKKQNVSVINEKLVCNGNEIEKVSVFTYLGIQVDEHFTFKDHLAAVLTKISKSAGMITKLKRMLTPHLLTILINAYINSVTDYCLSVWGPSRQVDFPKIQKVTNDLLATFYFPNLMKFKRKRFWANRNVTELVDAKRECIVAYRNIDYFKLLKKCIYN